jgi:hypothetical protein
MQRNPKLSTLKTQFKIHKLGNPTRPVINNMNAPSYKIAKHLINKLNGYLCLNNQYNVKNTTSLADDLTKLKINEHHKMMTYDIKDLYVNTPIKKTLEHKINPSKTQRRTSSKADNHFTENHSSAKLLFI